MPPQSILLCPGQGAQTVGMGRAWVDAHPAAGAVFDEADAILGDALGAPLRELCLSGPADRLNRTAVSQPALYTCAVACFRGLDTTGTVPPAVGAAGLSLGEYTALHLAGVFDFATGLRLVATRGRLMQEAAEASEGGMVALIGADEAQAREVCARAAEGRVLVPANFNAPGQIVLSGHADACARATAEAERMDLRATPLTVAGAFHSPLMQPAADRMEEALAAETYHSPNITVWANVTGKPYDPDDPELLRERLVQQIVNPVRWSETCEDLPSGDGIEYHELAPGTVLRGLMRRIDRNKRVNSHDQP